MPNTHGAFSKLTSHGYCWEILMCSLPNVHECNVKLSDTRTNHCDLMVAIKTRNEVIVVQTREMLQILTWQHLEATNHHTRIIIPVKQL